MLCFIIVLTSFFRCKLNPTTVDLTVGRAVSFAQNESTYLGLCSNYLRDRQPNTDERVSLFVKPAAFRFASLTYAHTTEPMS